MRAVIQRVGSASVTIEGKVYSSIEQGLMILAGFENSDTDISIDRLCSKIVNMRIFPDCEGKMNLSILDTGGEILAVSQFTLYASTRKGNRPSFIRAAPPSISEPLYETFVKRLGALLGKPVATGVFGANMKVALVNDGPVTIVIDSIFDF
jgi:D-tyrosyl-tRNA(Tyr) deacylase